MDKYSSAVWAGFTMKTNKKADWNRTVTLGEYEAIVYIGLITTNNQ